MLYHAQCFSFIPLVYGVCVCARVHVRACIRVHPSMSLCMHRLEANLGCGLSGTIHLAFEIGSLTGLVLTKQVRPTGQ